MRNHSKIKIKTLETSMIDLSEKKALLDHFPKVMIIISYYLDLEFIILWIMALLKLN